MVKNTDLNLDNIFKILNPKQVRVLKDRYGLLGKRKTLQEIGDGLGITRERVRQIENQSLKKVKNSISSEFALMISSAKQYLESQNGVEEDEKFVKEIATLASVNPVNKNWREKIRFVFFAAGTPFYFDENQDFKSFWYLSENAKTQFLSFVDKTMRTFESTDKNKIIGDQNFISKIKSVPEYNLLFVSKKFSLNTFGDIGLISWSEINPKNVRDKAYLALKKENGPMHFRDIAKKIIKSNISSKKVNVQTVHNELIKDNRFVLVGRGVYALKENGYEPGTVKDVIASLIKTKGPLNSEDVVKLVNEKRILKENTILLNLQNRKHFRRLNDGKYSLHEA